MPRSCSRVVSTGQPGLPHGLVASRLPPGTASETEVPEAASLLYGESQTCRSLAPAAALLLPQPMATESHKAVSDSKGRK